MKLNVNEMQFDVCVPAEEVMGEPEIGRRFKGTIWLQGYINFQDKVSGVSDPELQNFHEPGEMQNFDETTKKG